MKLMVGAGTPVAVHVSVAVSFSMAKKRSRLDSTDGVTSGRDYGDQHKTILVERRVVNIPNIVT